MMQNQAAYTLVCIGIIVPAVYVLFVIFLTRRGREFSRLEGLFASMEQLHTALHAAFMEERKEKPLKGP